MVHNDSPNGVHYLLNLNLNFLFIILIYTRIYSVEHEYTY